MATVVLLTLFPLIRADSCSTYTSGYCTPFVNYPIFVATGGSIAAQEAKLKAGGMDLLLTLNASNPANRPCVSAFLEWACYTSYPSCANDALQNVPCKSVCANSVSQCKTLFGMFGKTNSLPNCEDSVQGLTVPYGTTPSCLGYSATPTSSDVAKPTGQPPAPASCPSFLIRNPDYNTSNPSQPLTPVLGRQCNGPCCVPCPHVHQFYDPSNFQSLNIANQVLVVLSFCGSSFIVISYLVFPSKREHPGAIMWFFSLGIFLYHLFQLSIVGSDGYRVSCVDEITESKQQNNTLCAIQAFIQTFAALYLIFWINMFILNLHLTVVWRKDWFTDKYVYYRIFSLIYAFIPAIGVLATGSGASIGYSCLADVRNVKGFILYPMAVLGWPGVALTIFTVLYLIRLLLSAPDSGKANSAGVSVAPGKSVPPLPLNNLNSGDNPDGSTNKVENNSLAPKVPENRKSGTFVMDRAPSANGLEKAGGSFHNILERQKSIISEKGIPINTGEKRKQSMATSIKTTQIEESASNMAKKLKQHKEKIWAVLIKTWRSLLLSVSIVLIFGSFWTFNLIVANTFIEVGPSTPWLGSWYTCALSGKSRAECAQVAAPNIPPFSNIALSNVVSSTGLCTFLIFGTGFIGDWKKLYQEKVIKK